jgi:hypothetical protein
MATCCIARTHDTSQGRNAHLFDVGTGALDDELIHSVPVQRDVTLHSQILLQLATQRLQQSGLAATRRTQQQCEAPLLAAMAEVFAEVSPTGLPLSAPTHPPTHTPIHRN